MDEFRNAAEHIDDAQRAESKPSEQRDYKPSDTHVEAPVATMNSPELRASCEDVENYLRSLDISRDTIDMASGNMERLLECWSEKQNVSLIEVNPGEPGTILHANIYKPLQQMLEGARNYAETKAGIDGQSRTDALARLNAALAKVQEASTPKAPEAPVKAPVQAPAAAPAEAKETQPADLYGRILAELKAGPAAGKLESLVEPDAHTVAETEAALAAAKLPDGRYNNRKLIDEQGRFIRLNAGKADTAYQVLLSDAESDGKGGHKWIVEGGKVVGFQVNDMGTRFQAHRQFAPGTETYTLKLNNNDEAWQIANNQQEFLAKLTKDFAAAGKHVEIAVNRGTNELVVRRAPDKNKPAPAAAPRVAPMRRPAYAAPARQPSYRAPARVEATPPPPPATKAEAPKNSTTKWKGAGGLQTGARNSVNTTPKPPYNTAGIDMIPRGGGMF